MRFEPAWVAAAVLCLTASCLKFDPFTCSEDAQCNLGSQIGYCQDSGFCAYPDFGCPSGLRYGDDAGGGLGGTCVVEPTDTEASDGSSTTEGSTGSDTSALDDTSSSGPTSDETGDACGGPGEPCCGGDQCDDGLACAGTACGCALEVTAGQRHSCAIKVDGTVWCWGANDLAQVRTPAGAAELVPVSVGDSFGAAGKALTLSSRNHTCALRDDALAICWGANAAGQSDPTEPADGVDPRAASWAQSATTVGVGLSHTCVGRSAGLVASCWGSNAQAQLSGELEGPGPVDIGGALVFAQVELGDVHTCGRTEFGEVWCWGDNAHGQLGEDPALLPSSTGLHPVQLPAVDEIALGARHSCARAGDEVWCWGRNDFGQLGDGTGTLQFVPVAIALPAAGLSVQSLTSGPDHTCVITTDGALWCWGSNASGQLMLEPDQTGDDSRTLVPVEIEVGAGVLSFAGGASHSCALVETGALVCWGTNVHGQIGTGDQFFAFEPRAVELACP